MLDEENHVCQMKPPGEYEEETQEYDPAVRYDLLEK